MNGFTDYQMTIVRARQQRLAEESATERLVRATRAASSPKRRFRFDWRAWLRPTFEREESLVERTGEPLARLSAAARSAACECDEPRPRLGGVA